jgi:hypothetical protein
MCGFPYGPAVLHERARQVPSSSDARCPVFAGVALLHGSANAGDFGRAEIQAQLT